MRRERILLALGLALAPTPSPAGKGSSGSGSPPPARPAAAPVPAAKPAAGFPATWPTNAEVFAGAKAGDWVAYTQSASQGGQVRSMSLWQTYEGGGAGGSVVAQATAPSTGAPGAPPAPGTAGVQAQRLVLKPGDPFQGAPMIPGATVVRDSTRSQPFAGLAIGTAEYAGTRFVRDLAVRLPAGVELGYTITLWLSPQVPGPGMVKHMTELSPMAGVSVVQLVTSSRAVAEAAAALAFESPADILRYGEAAAKRAWPAGAKDWDRLTEQKLYAEARVRTLLALGRAAEAEKAFGALDPGSPGRYALGEELRRAAARPAIRPTTSGAWPRPPAGKGGMGARSKK